MATAEISYALQLIDQYIDQIEGWEAKGKYNQHSKEFFDFVKEYGANVGKVVRIIQSANGKAPVQIKSKGDAQEIRGNGQKKMCALFLIIIQKGKILMKITSKTITKSEYFLEIERSLSVTDEQWMFEELPDDLFDVQTLTEMLLESGECAFGNLIFERELFRVFHTWMGTVKDQSLKIWMYSNSLLSQIPQDTSLDFRERLTDYAQGNWLKYRNSNTCPWPTLPEEYLKNWNWSMHLFASQYWDEKRRIKESRIDLIFNQKHPEWPKK
jgi:hypothetical protein